MLRILRVLLFVVTNIVIRANGVTSRRTITSWVDVPPVLRSTSSASIHLANWGNNAEGRKDNSINVDDDNRAQASTQGRRVPFIIQNIGRGKNSEIDEIVRLCIDVFFNEQEDVAANGEGGKKQVTPWKALQLAYLRNFQTGDILARNAFQQDQLVDLIVARRVYPVPSGTKINGNREGFIDDVTRIYNAERPTSTNGGEVMYSTGEIIGYCEVSEKNFGLGDNFETRRRKDATKMPRPYLSNLSVVEGARNSGVGSKLLDACEEAVRNWKANHTEIVLQVEEDNPTAIQFYKARGWEFVFADPTCRRYDTSGFFLRESRITKYAMIKRLDAVGNLGKTPEKASDIRSSLIQKLRSSFFVQ